MKEHPILFTPANYRSILDGTKTQTRRIIALPKDRGIWESSTIGGVGCTDSKGHPVAERPCIWNTTTGTVLCCPYGIVGDRLWVREGLERYFDCLDYVRYRRDGKLVNGKFWEWKRDTLSPIHMPKWAARLWLEIIEVRVERLRAISEEDAEAEGAFPMTGEAGDNYRRGYRFLWESINGAGSWGVNPWVWAITFKQVSA